MAIVPPFYRLARRGFDQRETTQGLFRSNRTFILNKYAALDAFDVQEYASTFTANGQFTIAGATSVGPAAIKAAIDGFFAILEPGGISHSVTGFEEVGDTVNMWADVTYNVLNDPDPYVLRANTRLVTRRVNGVRKWVEVQVYFDVPPQVLFDAFATANP